MTRKVSELHILTNCFSRIRSLIIHKLGGVTKSEVPFHEKVHFAVEYIEPPQRISYLHEYTVYEQGQGSIAEGYAKREVLEKLAKALDDNGFVRYTISNFDDFYDRERNIVRKAIMADVWAVKMPKEVTDNEYR